MARFVYVDETGSSGSGGRQPLLMLAAAIVDETIIQALAKGLDKVAWKHLGWLPADLEFHGHEIWQGLNHWANKTPPQLLAVFDDALTLLDLCDIDVAYASIDKAKLNIKYGGAADENAYLLALQFLLEKIDRNIGGLKIVVADEAKEEALRAIAMVSELQNWNLGVVPGRQLKSIVDTLHFVRSHDSPGVQMADLIAYVLQRHRRGAPHPDARAALDRYYAQISSHTRTWREKWPA